MLKIPRPKYEVRKGAFLVINLTLNSAPSKKIPKALNLNALTSQILEKE